MGEARFILGPDPELALLAVFKACSVFGDPIPTQHVKPSVSGCPTCSGSALCCGCQEARLSPVYAADVVEFWRRHVVGGERRGVVTFEGTPVKVTFEFGGKVLDFGDSSDAVALATRSLQLVAKEGADVSVLEDIGKAPSTARRLFTEGLVGALRDALTTAPAVPVRALTRVDIGEIGLSRDAFVLAERLPRRLGIGGRVASAIFNSSGFCQPWTVAHAFSSTVFVNEHNAEFTVGRDEIWDHHFKMILEDRGGQAESILTTRSDVQKGTLEGGTPFGAMALLLGDALEAEGLELVGTIGRCAVSWNRAFAVPAPSECILALEELRKAIEDDPSVMTAGHADFAPGGRLHAIRDSTAALWKAAEGRDAFDAWERTPALLAEARFSPRAILEGALGFDGPDAFYFPAWRPEGLSVRYDANLKESTIEISDVHEGSILVIIVRRSNHDQEPWAHVTTKRAEAHKTRWSCAVTTVAPYSREHSAFIPSGVKEYEKVAEFFVVDTAEGGALPFAYHFIAGNEWL